MADKSVKTNTDIKHEEKKVENIDDFFVWQDYLDSTNSKEVPQILFSHVEQSLQSGFQEGMKVEVPLKDDLNNYWVATIITACGPLLSLRYIGDKDDRSKDFWCDTSKCELRPLGWTETHGKILVPPNHLSGIISHKDLKSVLKGTQTISANIVGSDCSTPIDRIKQGMKIEVQDNLHPYHLWVATVIESVGGRLLLRYDTPDSTSDRDFWLFYLSPRLFPIGWAEKKGDPWKLVKPSCFNDSHHSDSEWEAVLEMSEEEEQNNLSSSDLFQKNISETVPHNFSVGMKLEVVHPQNRAEICPASVSEVFDDKYFLVSIDDTTPSNESEVEIEDGNNNSNELACLAFESHPYIFPCGWAKSHNLKLTHPRGWISSKEEFDWDEYLEETKSTPALFNNDYSKNIATDNGFEIGMKLEVASPENEHQICAATIANITEHLLWIHLDSSDCFEPSIIFDLDSLDMFPVGWCEMNNYPLKPPLSYQPVQLSQSSESSSVSAESDAPNIKSEDIKEKNKDLSKSNSESKGSFWCPKIFFNHKCFSGPFLSKGKLAQLPKAVGPGPVTLVMKEVLSMLISVAYISSRVLRELQCKTKPHPGMHLEVLKAKYKSNAYRASVEIVTSADKVTDFCKDICRKLQVCPYLFGPIAVGEKSCPENCSTLSKTRFCKNRSVGSGNSSNNNNNNNMNSSNNDGSTNTSSNLIKKCITPDVETSSSHTTRNSNNKLFSWPRRKRGLEKDYFSGFGKENEDVSPGGKRVRYETRGVKLPNFGLKKQNGSNVSISSNSTNIGNDNANCVSIINNSTSINNNTTSTSSSFSSTIVKPHSQSQQLHHSPAGSDCSSVSSMMNENSSSLPSPLKKKRGRHSKAKKEELRKAAQLASDAKMDDSLYQVDSNPLLWTVEDVYDYLRNTDDCDVLANLLKEEEFDGKSFMLLNLPSCLDSLKLNLKTALSLCRHVEAVKFTFFCKYVIPTSSSQIDDS